MRYTRHDRTLRAIRDEPALLAGGRAGHAAAGLVEATVTSEILVGDCLDVLATMEPDSVDLVFGSPPYEAARTYGINYTLKCEEWVAWAVERYLACLRVSRGLVAWVVEGRTRNYAYSATPILLMADLQRRGVFLRKPPAFHRVGIPGSGGPDWLRNDWEPIVCATRKRGKLPWSDNKAMGHPPKWAPGGEMSHRVSDGSRVNQWGHSLDSGATVVSGDGQVRSKGKRPSHSLANRDQWGGTGGSVSNRKPSGKRETWKRPSHKKSPASRRPHTKRRADGEMEIQSYEPPVIANPGNVLRFNVGGGQMGSKLAHENEAPFPEALAEFFIRSFCPLGGTVLDPFGGSGTTMAAAIQAGRNAISIDVRESQVELMRRREAEARERINQEMFAFTGDQTDDT